MKRLLISLCLAALLPAALAQQLKLRILGTTDVHMNLLAYDYYQDKAVEEYGLARTATLIRAAATRTSRVGLRSGLTSEAIFGR